MTETVSLPAEQLGKHALRQAFETCGCGGFVDDEVEYSLRDAVDNIEYVESISNEDGMEGVLVYAEINGRVSERVSMGTRFQPPEYETHDIPIGIAVTWIPRSDSFEAEVECEIEQIGTNPLTPPNPEPYEGP